MTDPTGYQGTQRPGTDGGDYNSQTFLAQSLINRINSATLVQVVAVTNAGALSPVGFVDVQPLVNQLDGENNAMPHAVVYNVPYFRLQGGADAIIIDPKVGDIGIAVFADHDISSVKVNKAQANPGSARRFALADGMYIGGMLNGTPTQYIRYSASGIEIHSPTKVTISAPQVEIDATTKLQITTPLSETDAPIIVMNGVIAQTNGTGTGTSTFGGALTVQGQLKSNTEVVAVTTPLHTHAHTGVTTGAGATGGPTP